MRSGTCPKCSSTTVHGAREQFGWGGSKGVHIRTSNVTPSTVVDTYICTTCGYFENYVANPSKLAEVTQAWGKVEPQ